MNSITPRGHEDAPGSQAVQASLSAAQQASLPSRDPQSHKVHPPSLTTSLSEAVFRAAGFL